MIYILPHLHASQFLVHVGVPEHNRTILESDKHEAGPIVSSHANEDASRSISLHNFKKRPLGRMSSRLTKEANRRLIEQHPLILQQLTSF